MACLGVLCVSLCVCPLFADSARMHWHEGAICVSLVRILPGLVELCQARVIRAFSVSSIYATVRSSTQHVC